MCDAFLNLLKSNMHVNTYSKFKFIFFVYNNSRVSLNILYITIDECLLLSC